MYKLSCSDILHRLNQIRDYQEDDGKPWNYRYYYDGFLDDIRDLHVWLEEALIRQPDPTPTDDVLDIGRR